MLKKGTGKLAGQVKMCKKITREQGNERLETRDTSPWQSERYVGMINGTLCRGR